MSELDNLVRDQERSASVPGREVSGARRGAGESREAMSELRRVWNFFIIIVGHVMFWGFVWLAFHTFSR
jgi:hypothetical protein